MSSEQLEAIAFQISYGELEIEELDDMMLSSDDRAYILHLVDKFESLENEEDDYDDDEESYEDEDDEDE